MNAKEFFFTTVRASDDQRSIFLDGVNDKIVIQDQYTLTSTLSCFGWAKAIAQKIPNKQGTIAGQWRPVGNKLWRLAQINQQLVATVTDGVNTLQKISNDPVFAGTWGLYGFTFGGGVLRLYVNGVEVAGTVSGGAVTNISASNQNLTLGASTDDDYWFGTLNHVCLFNSELTAEDVSAMWNGGQPKNMFEYPVGGLIGWWKLGEHQEQFPVIPDETEISNGRAIGILPDALVEDVP